MLMYGALVATGSWLLATGVTVLGAVGLAGAAVAVLVTATTAGPLHGRLTAYDETLVRRLLVADRWRCAAALTGAVAAAVYAGW